MSEPKVWIDYTHCREMTPEEIEEAERWNEEFLDDEGYVNSLLAGEEV